MTCNFPVTTSLEAVMKQAKIIISLLSLSFLILSACSKKLKTYQPGDFIKVELEHGTLIQLDDTVASIEFIRVVEDSRCPEGVQCFWAGQFIAELRLNQKHLFHVGLGNYFVNAPDAIPFILYKNHKISILKTICRGNMKSVRYLVLQVEKN